MPLFSQSWWFLTNTILRDFVEEQFAHFKIFDMTLVTWFAVPFTLVSFHLKFFIFILILELIGPLISFFTWYLHIHNLREKVIMLFNIEKSTNLFAYSLSISICRRECMSWIKSKWQRVPNELKTKKEEGLDIQMYRGVGNRHQMMREVKEEWVKRTDKRLVGAYFTRLYDAT